MRYMKRVLLLAIQAKINCSMKHCFYGAYRWAIFMCVEYPIRVVYSYFEDALFKLNYGPDSALANRLNSGNVYLKSGAARVNIMHRMKRHI